MFHQGFRTAKRLPQTNVECFRVFHLPLWWPRGSWLRVHPCSIPYFQKENWCCIRTSRHLCKKLLHQNERQTGQVSRKTHHCYSKLDGLSMEPGLISGWRTLFWMNLLDAPTLKSRIWTHTQSDVDSAALRAAARPGQVWIVAVWHQPQSQQEGDGNRVFGVRLRVARITNQERTS